MIFDNNLLQQLGIGNTGAKEQITDAQLDYQYRLGFLMFCVDLSDYFNKNGFTFDFKQFNLNVDNGRLEDVVDGKKADRMISRGKDIMRIIKSSESKGAEDLYQYFEHYENFRQETIFSLGTLKKSIIIEKCRIFT